MRTLRWMLVAMTAAAAGAAQARDDHLMLPLSEALSAPVAVEKLDPKIKLFFGKEPTPAVERSMGTWKTNKKTNAFGKSDKVACDWAFLSAMLQLQERARKQGGDAVLGIESVYKDIITSSETHYMCGAGAMVAGVAFRGEVVKLQ